MKVIMEPLLALQRLEFGGRSLGAAAQTEMGKLRDRVPATVLLHYERLTSRGRKGVAIARNGVCSECHLRITGAKLISLGHHSEVQRCDNCGRYLYLPEAELSGVIDPRPATSATAKRS